MEEVTCHQVGYIHHADRLLRSRSSTGKPDQAANEILEYLMGEIDLWKFIGNALRNRRLSAGMKIEELSARSGICADKLLAFEEDTREMDHEALNRICMELGVESMTLFGEFPLSERFASTTNVVERWLETVS